MSDKTTTIHVRIDLDTLAKLKKLAAFEKRTLSNLLRKILIEYLAKKS